MATQNKNNKKKPLPKVKSSTGVGELLAASNNELRQIAVAKKAVAETYKKVKWAAANPRKAYKQAKENTAKVVKGTAIASIVSEVPVLGLLFGRDKKKKQQEQKKKATNKSILDTILKEVKLIKAAMKSTPAAKGKGTSTTTSAKEETETEDNVDTQQEEPQKLGTAAKVGLLAVGGLAVLHLFRSGKDYKPNQPIPPQPEGPPRPEPQIGGMNQQTQGIQGPNPEQQLDELLKKFDGFPDTVEGITKKIEAARKDFEKQTGVKIGEQVQQPSEQPVPQTAVVNPYQQELNKQAEDLAAAYQPAPRPTPAATQPEIKPEETPGAIRTEYGGVLVTSEGKAVTAPATVPEVKPTVVPAPTPVPVLPPQPAPAPTPVRPAPTPQPTPIPVPPPRPSAGIPAPLPLPSGDDRSVMEMIKRHEGVRTKPYKDSLGLWTVGVGHLIGDGKTLPPEWNREFTMEEIDKLFMEDYSHHKKAAEKIPAFNKMNSLGQGALIDLTFNMGPAWYKKWPTLMKQLSAGDFSSAADNLKNSTWFKQVKSRGVTIVNMIRNGGVEKPQTSPVENQPSAGTQLAEASTAVQSQRPRTTNTRVMIIKDTQRVSLPAQ